MGYERAMTEINRCSTEAKRALRDELNRQLGEQAIQPASQSQLNLIYQSGFIDGMRRMKEIDKNALTTVLTNRQKHADEEILAMNHFFGVMQYITTVIVCGLEANSNPMIIKMVKGYAGNLADAFVNYRKSCRWRGDDAAELAPLTNEMIQLVEIAENRNTEPIKRFVIEKGGSAYNDELRKWRDERSELPTRGRDRKPGYTYIYNKGHDYAQKHKISLNTTNGLTKVAEGLLRHLRTNKHIGTQEEKEEQQAAWDELNNHRLLTGGEWKWQKGLRTLMRTAMKLNVG